MNNGRIAAKGASPLAILIPGSVPRTPEGIGNHRTITAFAGTDPIAENLAGHGLSTKGGI